VDPRRGLITDEEDFMEHTSFDLETNEPMVGTTAAGDAPAWEQVTPGRYRPRRIRGSCVGRELG
jgi:hypothetical protein